MNLMNQKSNENDSSYNTPFSSSASSSESSSPSPSTPSESSTNRASSSLGELIKFALLVLIVVIPIRIFIAKPFIVNGASMDPTFATGQYLVIDQLSYYFQNPARGDVVVFKYPVDPSKYFIKRIIGLPGETVSMRSGKVFIVNNENPEGFQLDEPYLVQHSYDTTEETVLTSGEYFVMGDNRPASSDSRIWGPLGMGDITGRPIFRLTPLRKISIWPGTIDKDSQTKTTSSTSPSTPPTR